VEELLKEDKNNEQALKFKKEHKNLFAQRHKFFR